MTIDLSTIPAISDEPERTFSSCSLMIASYRGSVKPDFVDATQCSKKWLKGGVITPQLLTIRTEAAAIYITAEDWLL
jgi:hypothetical protein